MYVTEKVRDARHLHHASDMDVVRLERKNLFDCNYNEVRILKLGHMAGQAPW